MMAKTIEKAGGPEREGMSPALWLVPMRRKDPPAAGECMLWQLVHSATPPEWNA